MSNLKVISPDNLGVEFDLGLLVANKVSVKKSTSAVSGIVKLAVAASYPAPTNDTDAATAAFVKAAIDAAVAALPADKFLQSFSYSSATKVLTLTSSDGTSVSGSLADLLPVAVTNSQNVIVSGNGTTASPLTASAIIDSITGNLLKSSATGLAILPADVKALASIEIQDAFGSHIGYAFV